MKDHNKYTKTVLTALVLLLANQLSSSKSLNGKSVSNLGDIQAAKNLIGMHLEGIGSTMKIG